MENKKLKDELTYQNNLCIKKFPKERWNEIKIAEKNDNEGQKMMKKLGVEFDSTYRKFKATALDLHD